MYLQGNKTCEKSYNSLICCTINGIKTESNFFFKTNNNNLIRRERTGK